MSTALRAIETTGLLEAQRRLWLDTPLPVSVVDPIPVRIIVLFPEEIYEEISEPEWLHAAATNPAFSFLKDAAEDIYTLSDGRPFDDKG